MDCEHKVSSRVVAAPDATRAPATPTPLFSFYAGRLIHGDEGLECLIGSRDVTLIDGLDPHAHDEPAILWRGCERQQFGIAAATARPELPDPGKGAIGRLERLTPVGFAVRRPEVEDRVVIAGPEVVVDLPSSLMMKSRVLGQINCNRSVGCPTAARRCKESYRCEERHAPSPPCTRCACRSHRHHFIPPFECQPMLRNAPSI
jgi:hypothetical protein